MNKALSVTAGLVLAFVAGYGISLLVPGALLLGPKTANPHLPNVAVLDDETIVVDQEPVYVPKNDNDKTITWQLDRNGGWKFDGTSGITIEAAGQSVITGCKSPQDDYRFTCKNSKTRGTYKYSITVIKNGSTAKITFDPYIKNG